LRLTLELLEERLTPSGGGTTVTQKADSYAMLTGLIAGDTNPNTNYVIQITNSFTFSPGDLVTISKLASTSTLTVEGQNGNNFTLTGQDNRRFDLATMNQNVFLTNLTVVPGNGTATFSTTTQTVPITVGVTSTTTVKVGTVSVIAFNSTGTSVASDTGNVTNGKTIVELSLPAGLAAGSYTLTELYTDSSGHFAANSATGTLTINPISSPSRSPKLNPTPSPSAGPSPSASPSLSGPPTAMEAYLEIAIDVAALLLQGNSMGLSGLFDLSEALLQKPLTPASDLLGEILVDLPYAGDMAFSAVQLGMAFAQSASFEISDSGGAKSFIL
jgi:hypothetical protein